MSLVLAPDDSGKNWKPPFIWKANIAYDQWSSKEIDDLVLAEIGEDELFARGYNILALLYKAPETDDLGLTKPGHELRNKSIETTVAKVLRMGDCAFKDRVRFPTGPTVTYGEWGVFRGSQRQVQEVNGHQLAFITDDRFLGVAKHPEKVRTGSSLEFDWGGQ